MGILVTGGAGFIGSHLVDLLIRKRKDVIVVDNLVKGKTINPKSKFIKCDVRTNEIFKKIINDDISEIFHLAALTNARESIVKPKLYFEVNVLGSLNILELCRRLDTKIIFTSSAAVYGNYKRPVRENDLCKPLSPYGKYKLLVEELIKFYNKVYGISFGIFRLFNVYGPRGDSVINVLVDCVKNKKAFCLFGNGKQERDFIFIGDVVRILTNHAKVENKILNVCTGKSTSVLKLIKLFQKIDPQLKVIKKKRIKGEIKTSKGSVNKLKKFFPTFRFTPLIEGISKCL
jgi:UDP-glucose 4-epimerase